MTDGAPGASILALRDVTVNFGNVVAIQGVAFEVERGEIVGLVGDNGAGKSTLVKVMNGFYAPGRGVMQFKGRPVRFSSPRDARSVGIETVYQDLALIPALSMWRNFFLGRELKAGRAVPVPRHEQDARHHDGEPARDGPDPAALAGRAGRHPVGGERQALAIARARYFGGSLLLLDEPTSALSVKETEKVSEAVQIARKDGLGVVIIDHNIAHVHRICDRIVIMEAGRVIRSVRRDDVSAQHVADMVAGRHAL